MHLELKHLFCYYMYLLENGNVILGKHNVAIIHIGEMNDVAMILNTSLRDQF